MGSRYIGEEIMSSVFINDETKIELRLDRELLGGKVSMSFSAPGYGPLPVIVSCWGPESYSNRIKQLEILPGLQYLEVGAGVGGFIPSVVGKLEGTESPKPIVIDMIDYSALISLLEEAGNYFSNDGRKVEKIGELLGRISIITDPSKVRFINSKLELALQAHPDLEGIADVVVDNLGADTYYWTTRPDDQRVEGMKATEMREDVRNIERRLLREGGVLLGDTLEWRKEPAQKGV